MNADFTAAQRPIPQRPTKDDLFGAIYAGDAAKVAALLEQGADPNGCEGKAFPLITAAARGHADIVEALLDHGAAIDAKNNSRFNALHAAVANGKTDVVRVLVERGAALDEQLHTGNTALIEAMNRGNAEIARLLIEGLADINKRNGSGYTALRLAEHYAHVKIAQMLRDAPAMQEKIRQDRLRVLREKEQHAVASDKQEWLRVKAGKRRITF